MLGSQPDPRGDCVTQSDFDPSGSVSIRYKLVRPSESSVVPEYRTAGAAGMDLQACLTEPVAVRPLERVRIPTGIAIEIPRGDIVGLVYARSGLAWRHGIALPNGVGVIDSDYTGEIQVLLTNFSETPFTIQPGDRVAQLVFAPIYVASLVPAGVLKQTDRGSAGFGSTGISDT